jgi:hypothetical protein
MRLALVFALLLALAPTARADDDDPKLTRASPAEPFALPGEDDPKLTRGAPPSSRPWWRPTHVVPRFKLAYRRLWTAGLQGGSTPFDVTELDFYPASGLIRFGVEGEFGWAGGAYDMWYLLVGATLGVQWPARVTPFLEGRFVAGLIGGVYERQLAMSWMYQGGIEGGVEVYYARRFYLSAAIGWSRPVYGAVDVNALLANPGSEPIRKTLSADTLTIKVGLGL